MASASTSGPSASPSMVDFPLFDPSSPAPPSSYMQHARPPHLPFRRISLPSAPSQLNRQSVVSMASFDSLPEEARDTFSTTPPVNKSPVKKARSRPSSTELQRKAHRRREARPVDAAKLAKRVKVIEEFYETERTYVQGLDLIYSHFLTPIIAALDTPQPLLNRAELTSVFSNFIDIWNFHRSFFSSLTEHLHSPPVPSSSTRQNATASSSQATTSELSSHPLSPVLLSHFPYLSLYTPFVTSFHESISSLTILLNSNNLFSTFVAQQEADPRCGKLKLRDWLLTIVQRCPRYLLLLKDLINCTDTEDAERASLMAAHSLVSKITISLNSSLYMHEQTLSLLALQRSTPNLPFQLISPGRTFLKRGALLQLERASLPKEREFLLFSDCLLWLANLDRGDSELAERWDWMAGGAPKDAMLDGKRRAWGRLPVLRSRSRSEADFKRSLVPMPPSPVRPSSSARSSRSGVSPVRGSKTRQASNGTGEEKWWFKGKVELVDAEIVMSPPTELGEETRFELLSPEGSFALYAESSEQRDEWAQAIRNAKASLLISLNSTHPNSTLTSSSSTQHIRRMLQALPHLPEEEGRKPKRGKVEHFVPPVWIPDGKTESCMRCARTFGWRRRRHHCRLCGRCVCASCSGSTFFITDPDAKEAKDTSKSARACDACYETVFPIIDPSASPHVPAPTHTLSGFPSWQSMPALAMSSSKARPASALMAIDTSTPKRALTRIDDVSDTPGEFEPSDSRNGDRTPPRPVIRVKPPSRPRSFHQILEDFRGQPDSGDPSANGNGSAPPQPSPATSHFSVRTGRTYDSTDTAAGEVASPESLGGHSAAFTPATSPTRRREDTARRHKRFSMPAVGLHTAPVTARPNSSGEGLSKRISLVLGGKSGGSARHDSESPPASASSSSSLKHSAAVVKLGELLGRRKHTR